MVMGFGKTESGSGVAQFINPLDGARKVTGRYLSQSQGLLQQVFQFLKI